MPRTKSPKPYLEFKFLKNAMIDIGDAKHYRVPSDMRNLPNPQAPLKHGKPRSAAEATMIRLDEPDTYITMPYFDFDKVHKVELQDELPRVPKKMPGMSDDHHQKLCDQAYERAARAKNFNDAIRTRVYHYVDDGTLEVVSDPFEGEDIVEGLAELAESLKAADAEKAEAGEHDPTAPIAVQEAPEDEPPAPRKPRK